MASADKPVIPNEEVDSAVDHLLQVARDAGRAIAESPGSGVSTQSTRKPNVDKLLRDGLRQAIEDEVVVAVDPASNDDAPTERQPGLIEQRDVEREVIKKALIGLRLARLKQIARSHGLRVSAQAEELATRIAQVYRWDEGEIAQLIQDNEDNESRPIRGTIERVFPLVRPPDVSYVEQRLDVVKGRYMRIGVARWFFFEKIHRVADAISVSGSYRAYEAEVVEEDGSPMLRPVPNLYETAFVVRPRRNISIRNGSVTTARQAIRAVELAARIEPLGYVVTSTAGTNKALQGSSEFLLDVLHTRLRTAGIDVDNLTVARFRLTDDPDEDEGNRPALRAVKFEGRHLLDSIEACRLLVTQKRPLAELSFLASYRSEPGALPARMEIKLALESDHVLVNTGYGSNPELSLSAHAGAVQAVQLEIENGVADTARLADLVRRISERAAETAMPDRPSVLSEKHPDNKSP